MTALPDQQLVSSDENHCVSLWAANIPFLGKLAIHHWFVINECNSASRWEVWQSTEAGAECWGHLHRNLMPATAWPHKDAPRLHHQWTGADGHRIAQRIKSSPHHYPWCHQYRYWPGPNSNTYVQWVLLEDYTLGWRAAGKNYCRFA